MRVYLASFVLLITISAFAQNGPPMTPQTKADRFLQRWTRELTLTPEQQNQAKPVVLTMFTKEDQIRMDTLQNKKARMMSARNEGMANFKAILTPDQSALFDKRMQEMKEKQKAKRQAGNQQPQNNKMKKAAKDTIDNDDVF